MRPEDGLKRAGSRALGPSQQTGLQPLDRPAACDTALFRWLLERGIGLIHVNCLITDTCSDNLHRGTHCQQIESETGMASRSWCMKEDRSDFIPVHAFSCTLPANSAFYMMVISLTPCLMAQGHGPSGCSLERRRSLHTAYLTKLIYMV